MPEGLYPINCTEKKKKNSKLRILYQQEQYQPGLKRSKIQKICREDDLVTTESGIGVGQLGATDCKGPLGSQEEAKRILLGAIPGRMPLLALGLQIPGFQNYESINLSCINLPSLWSFSRATQGN